jgi:hypothetical protein
MFGMSFLFCLINDSCRLGLLWSLALSPVYLRLIGITGVVPRYQPFWKKVESNVTTGTGGTLDGLLATVDLGQTVTRSVVMR